MEGQLVHVEVPAADAARAKAFYGSLFGWKFQPWQGGPEYHLTDSAEPSGAVFPSENAGEGLVPYFAVADIDASVARVRELGGEAQDKLPIPTVGWFSACEDTEGNPFRLFQSDESVPGDL